MYHHRKKKKKTRMKYIEFAAGRSTTTKQMDKCIGTHTHTHRMRRTKKKNDMQIYYCVRYALASVLTDYRLVYAMKQQQHIHFR